MSAKKLLKIFDFSNFSRGEKVSVAGYLGGEKPSRISRILGTAGYSSRLSYDDLVNAESEIGRTLFGPIPVGHNREFFQYRKNIWIWYESFTDATGVLTEMTVRFEVKPTGVFKKVSGAPNYLRVEGAELENFRKAAQRYLELVKRKLYC